uniref:C-C chemokine receptor type 8 n=1 Tax=Monopterus albus TaxID=43700 RepID=UPI0009B39FF4|nr:C-C chemokine receptor type 8-like [Monopterus albus]
MSVDRYLAIVHAVAAMRARTLCYGITASIIIWVVSVIMAIPQVVFANVENEEGVKQCQRLYPHESQQFWKMLRNFSENSVGLFVCLPIIIFCYVKILLVLSKSRNSNKGKAVKLIFTIVCVFVVCWVPYNVMIFLETLQLFDILNTCEASKTINSALTYAEIIALSHCCVNPVIYAFVGEKYRKSMGKSSRDPKEVTDEKGRRNNCGDKLSDATKTTGPYLMIRLGLLILRILIMGCLKVEIRSSLWRRA